jgi:Ca2+-binding EF-hand superfamily protein
MWTSFVYLCEDDPKEITENELKKVKRYVQLSNENDYVNNLSNNVHPTVCNFHLGKWGT